MGEAKTSNDIETRHTDAQFAAFLRWCSAHPGSILVIAVRWDLTRLARAVLTRVREREGITNVTSIVLDELSG
jgi:hypothetical protein